MPVIVGRPDRQTPMMRLRLNAVQFNPPWGVPERNARRTCCPASAATPRAMAEKGFRVYTVVDGERVEVNPLDVDWRSVSRERFPYLVRQDAGAANALGRIKFIMPNSEDIFMHDTPDRHLFSRPERAFSSGCIRLERPMDLLDVALEGTAGWDRARASSVLDSRATASVALARSLPVRLHYTTTVVEGGEVRVRPDIYGLDEAYARAMDALRRAASSRRPSRRAWPACAEVRRPRFRLPLLRRGAASPFGRREVVRAGLAGLGLAGRCGGGGAALAQAVAAGGGGGPRRLAIERVQTGETFDGVYWSDGRYDRDALRRLDWVFRDPSMEEATPMDPRLFDVLHTVARRLDARGAVPGDQRLPRAGDQRSAGAGLAARVARQPAHVGHGRGCAAAGARFHGHGAARGGDAGGRRRPLSPRRLRPPGLRPGAALVGAVRRVSGAGRGGVQHRGAGGGQGRRRLGSTGGRGGGCRASGVSHQARDASQPSPGGGGGGSRHSASPGGQRRRTCMWASWPRQGRTRRSQGAPASARQSSRLMAWLTSTRSTPGASAARRMRVVWPGSHCVRETPVSSGSTSGDDPDVLPRGGRGCAPWATGRARCRRRARSGGWHGRRASARRAAAPGRRSRARAGRASAPRRRNPGQRRAGPGGPRFRLRESRTACQPGPSGGRARAPAMQPSAGLPTTRGGPGAGPATADHSDAAGAARAGAARSGAARTAAAGAARRRPEFPRPLALRLSPRRRRATADGEQGQQERGGGGTDQKRRSNTVTTSPGCNSASRGARYSTGRPSSLIRVTET